MNSPNFVDTGPPPEKVTPLALDTRTGQSVGPDDRQSFIAHASPERKSIRCWDHFDGPPEAWSFAH